MSDTPVKILAFAGSAKKASLNKKLLAVAVAGARAAGAEVTVVDLADYPMPIMDEDLEAAEGAPEKATAFKALMIEADGFLISCPEYNSSITPLLKNVIDWASRAVGVFSSATGRAITLPAAPAPAPSTLASWSPFPPVSCKARA